VFAHRLVDVGAADRFDGDPGGCDPELDQLGVHEVRLRFGYALELR